MRSRTSIGSAGQGRRTWPVLLVLLAAVLVPALCVLWFMNAAMESERLAVRGRLSETYRQQLLTGQQRLEEHWLTLRGALDKAERLPPGEAFERLVRLGLADSFLIYGSSGLAYPVMAAEADWADGPASASQPATSLPAAAEMEDAGKWQSAAELYGKCAPAATDADAKAQALRAQGRCLARGGDSGGAIAVLVDTLGKSEYASARLGGDGADGRPPGRLIVPDALLLALQVAKANNKPVQAIADKLAAMLADYSGPAMPSAQRLFLMTALREETGRVQPTLAAEGLAAAYLDAQTASPGSAGFMRVPPSSSTPLGGAEGGKTSPSSAGGFNGATSPGSAGGFGASAGSLKPPALRGDLAEKDPADVGKNPTDGAGEGAITLTPAPGPRGRGVQGLQPAGALGLWVMPSSDGKAAALLTDERLSAVWQTLGPALAGARCVVRHGPFPSGEGEPFVSIAAGPLMPGWRLSLYLDGENRFAAASKRQNALYLYTGSAGIVFIVLLAGAMASYLGRQIKLTRLRNDLIATISHELRTPLASMRVLVDTLREGRSSGPSQQREYLELIAGENERLSRLIDNFLTFSRMERNKRAFVFGSVRADELVCAAAGAMRERFSSPGAKLELDVPADLPELYGDRDALMTVLLNLLDNAWKYSGDQKRVAVRVYQCGTPALGREEARAQPGSVGNSPRRATLCIEVTDNGIGLSRRAMRRIFDRFYQVDQTLSRRAGGCGLGLSIVKFILDAHGGSVEVSSQVGKGSTFSVRLPIRPQNGHGDGDGG